jgi:hypothetical protein
LYELNVSMEGAWEAPVPQYQGHSGYIMVSVCHTMARKVIYLFCDFMKPSIPSQYSNVRKES